MKLEEKNLLLAIGAATCAALSNTLMATLSKIEVVKGIDTSMVLLWRSIWALFFLIPIITFSPPSITFINKIKTKRFPLHLVRAVTGFIGVFLYFYCLRTLSLTVATLLYFTIPLFMPFVAYLWKRTPFSRFGWIGLIIGFIGVVIVVKPGHMLFHSTSLLGLLAGAVVAVSQFAAHLLTATEPGKRINFYYFLVVGLIALPISFVTHLDSWNSLQPIDYLFFLGIGVFGLAYVLLLTFALKHGPPVIVSSFLYTVVIYSIFFDWLIWGRVIHWLTFLGAFLVVFGVVLKFYLHRREIAHHKKK